MKKNPHTFSARHDKSGFSLIELMIVVVIIGVLAAISYPSYQSYTQQARRADAQMTLTRAGSQQEKFFSDCGYYAATLVGTRQCGTGAGNADSQLGLASDLSQDRHYQISLALNTSNSSCTAAGAACNGLAGAALTACNARCGYTLVANPNGTGVTTLQNNDGRVRFDSNGVKEWDKNNDSDYADAGENKWK